MDSVIAAAIHRGGHRRRLDQLRLADCGRARRLARRLCRSRLTCTAAAEHVTDGRRRTIVSPRDARQRFPRFVWAIIRRPAGRGYFPPLVGSFHYVTLVLPNDLR